MKYKHKKLIYSIWAVSQIQKRIPNVILPIFHKYFDQSDCFADKTSTNKKIRLVLIDWKFRGSEFRICCWIRRMESFTAVHCMYVFIYFATILAKDKENYTK